MIWLLLVLIMKRGFKAYGMKDVLAGYRLVSTSNTAKKWKPAKDVWASISGNRNLSVCMLLLFLWVCNKCGVEEDLSYEYYA